MARSEAILARSAYSIACAVSMQVTECLPSGRVSAWQLNAFLNSCAKRTASAVTAVQSGPFAHSFEAEGGAGNCLPHVGQR